MTFQPNENETTEFKRQLTDSLEKEVVSFLNSDKGGDIYIGVDNNGTIHGVESPDKLQLAIIDRIRNNILPTALGFFDVVSEQLEGKNVIHIIVARGTEKPYYLRKYGLSPNGAYIRVGTSVQQMTTDMIERLYASRNYISLRNIPSPRISLSFNQLKIYYDERGFAVNESFLENLDLYTPNGQLNYVAYLLADQNSISIKVAKYAGNNKVELVENEEYGYCSIVKATNSVLDKLDIENRTFTKITGNARRLQKQMFDKRAIREAFINAIVHNDYTKEVTPVVEIFSDRISITSYGGLVTGLSLEEFFAGRSMPRNREIMRVYRDLDLVEQLGSGMSRILSVYSADVFKVSDNFLEVSFPFAEGYSNTAVIEEINSPKSVGKETKASGKGQKSVGKETKVSGKRQKSVGKGTKASGKEQKSVGKGTKASGKGQKSVGKETKVTGKEQKSVGKTSRKILEQIKKDKTVTIYSLSITIEVTERSIQRNIQRLQKIGILKRIGGRKDGSWEITE